MSFVGIGVHGGVGRVNVLRVLSTDILEGHPTAAVERLYASSINNRIELLSDSPFFIESTVRQLPGVNVVKNACGPCRMRRDAGHVLADGNDDLVFCIVVEGEIVWTPHGGSPVVLQSGDVFLHPNEVPSQRMFPRPTTAFDVGVVRPLAEAILPRRARELLRRKIGSTKKPELGLLLGYISLLLGERQPISAAAAAMASTHVQDLLHAALQARGPASPDPARAKGGAARLSAMKADIAGHVTNMNLSIEDVARRHGVSPQHVRTLFRAEGTTFTKFVRAERLKRAYRLLTDGTRAGWNIGALAYDCGFADLSYFNRLFRRRYGMTPSEARALGARLQQPAPR